MFRLFFIFFLCWSSFSLSSAPYHVNLSTEQAQQLGLLIWKNEGQQKIEHLTTWNEGEDFPSLGIGHFIWYPTTDQGPFKEQFPQLLTFMRENGVVLPAWLIQSTLAPWQSRDKFYNAYHEPPLTELRILLSEQLAIQVRFIVLRLEKAIPHILANSTLAEQEIITTNLKQLSSPEALFTLLDYVNFKGEGINDKESYQDQGWGLKQVLLAMPTQSDNPLRGFGFAADEVLTRRVKNAPRDESRWLKGWRIRVHAYQNITLE